MVKVNQEVVKGPRDVEKCNNCGKRHLGTYSWNPDKCYMCGNVGHLPMHCLDLVKCYRYGNSGDIARECRQKEEGDQGGKGDQPKSVKKARVDAKQAIIQGSNEYKVSHPGKTSLHVTD